LKQKKTKQKISNLGLETRLKQNYFKNVEQKVRLLLIVRQKERTFKVMKSLSDVVLFDNVCYL